MEQPKGTDMVRVAVRKLKVECSQTHLWAIKTCSRFSSPVYGAETAVIIKCKYTDILKGQV